MPISRLMNARRMAGASLLAIAALSSAGARAAAQPASTTSAGAEGTQVEGVIVTAERGRGAATAPTKASLDQVQPESIISHAFIEQATPETGGWTTVVLIAPSISGITSNGGGIGDYNVVQMRGFKDGQFNVTYDGISFGDTNDPTHHGADYWPASTIGAAVVDRGPGAAGDLGQSNFGGAIHFFSPTVENRPGFVQRLTYGSFNTEAAVTTLNTGPLSFLGGGTLLLNFDERRSDGELSHSGGDAFNQLAKFVLPVGSSFVLTAFYAHEWTRFNFEDSSGPGETWQQIQLYGKNFSMTNIPTDEHYYGYNYERKATDFGYVDLRYQFNPSLSAENQTYEYYYANKTKSTNDLTGLVGGPNTSPPNVTTPPASASDIGGYDKLNDYHVYGDILRLNQDVGFGTLKIGGLIEGSQTQRHNEFIDFTLGGIPDDKFTPPKYPFTTNAKLLENSDWFQGQIFADFNWRPTEALTISPGFKYVNFTRDVNAANENVGGGAKNQPITATNTYTSPLYFMTANFKIRPDWSIYGQYATSFLIPSLSALYVTGAELQSLKPEKTTSYQTGTVFTRGNITADADIYLIDASNLYNSCNVPNPSAANPNATTAGFCNFGGARYKGVEGEAAYALPLGMTVFANASSNGARQLANAANPGAGIAANPAQELPNAPKWTYAFGALYRHGPLEGALTYKQVGAYVVYNGAVRFNLPSYDTVNASLGYTFGHFQLKVQGFNLLDKRTITSYAPSGSAKNLYAVDGSVYTFQAGRELSVTLAARY